MDSPAITAQEAACFPALSLPPEPDLDAVVTEILDDLLYCSRVWEAWEVGTMTQDDFGFAAEDEDIRSDVRSTLINLLAPQQDAIRRLRHHLKTERSGNLGLVATLARRTDQRNELQIEVDRLRAELEMMGGEL